MKKYISIFIVLISIIASAQSEDSLILLAFRNNPLLKSFQYRIESIRNKAESVNQLPPPTLAIEFNQIPVNSVNIWNDAESNALSLSQMFMLGGKLSAMRDVELSSINLEQANRRKAAIDVVSNIRMNYCNLWLTEKKIQVQKKTITLLQQLIDNLSVQYSINKVNQADLFSLNSEIITNQTQLINLDNEKRQYINNIIRYLGIKNIDTIYTIDEKHIDIDIDETNLEQLLVNQNPELSGMDAMREMNKAMLNSNNKDRFPDLMLQGMIMRMPQGMPITTKTDLTMLGMETGKTEYMYSVMASITLPFAPWSSGKYNYKEEEILVGIKGIDYQKDDMKNDMIMQLKNSILKYETSHNLLELYNIDVIPLYERTLNAQITSYQTNRLNINSVIDSFRMLLMQQMNLYMAQADIQMAAIEIEMMTGISLQKFMLEKESR